MLNLCWFKQKNIFECFRCFWKVLCFYKNRKISKTVLPYFGDSVVGHLSRMLQPQARVLFLATCSWVKGPVVRGTQNACFGGPSSREKHFECFGGLTWRLVGDSLQLRKTRVWQKLGQFLNLFQFSLEFLWLFTVFPISLNWIWPKHSITHISISIFASSLLKSSRKRYGFSLSHLISSCFKNNFLFVELSL